MNEFIEVKIYVTTTESVVVSGSREAVEKHIQFIEANRELPMAMDSRMLFLTRSSQQEQQWYRRGFVDGSQRGIEIASDIINSCLNPPVLVMSTCVKCGHKPEIPEGVKPA